MKLNGVEFDGQKIADFCRRHGISRLSLFGSILRDDFRPDSDIDVLVGFPPAARVSPHPRRRDGSAPSACSGTAWPTYAAITAWW